MSIEVGEKIPSFSLQDQNGDAFSAEDVKDNTWTVIYFYPKDHTPGCTAQACAFRDSYQEFKDHGAEVVGISSDSGSKHDGFAEKHHLPFRLLADTKGEARKAFGVKGHLLGLIPGRETFIVDSEGIVRHKFNSLTKIDQHIAHSLQVMQKKG